MLIEDIIGKFNQWKDKRTQLPIPPRTNLFHASPKHNHQSIMQQGLIRDGVCKLYVGCKEGKVYLADNAGVATHLLGDDNPGVNTDMINKSESKGVLYTVDSSKLDPALLSKDANLPAHWMDPKHTYTYAGDIPPSAIINHQEFTLTNSYYLNKTFRGLRPGPPGPQKA